jgi:RNA polymerase sigma-70 factor (ECF subfamily)
MAVDTANEEPHARPGAEFDALVQTVLVGDREAYRQIINLSQARVRMVLAAILPDSNAVEDVAQEVYVTAFYKLRDYRPGSEFLAWLTAITRNLALNERRRWRRSERFKENFEAQMEASLETQINHSADHLEGDAMVALRQCLDALGDQARSVTEDFYFKDLSSEQIAQRHQRKSGWVRLVLFRARSVLADCLQNKGVVQDAKPT